MRPFRLYNKEDKNVQEIELLQKLTSKIKINKSNLLIVSEKDFKQAEKIWDREGNLVKIPLMYYNKDSEVLYISGFFFITTKKLQGK